MKQIALDYFKNWYSCSESIVKAAADKGYCSEDLVKIATPFSGGMSVGCLCGAIAGAQIVIGAIFNKEDVIYRALDNLEYNDTVITDKGPLPIGKIVEENIDCKVQVTKNGETKFMKIKNRSCIDL